MFFPKDKKLNSAWQTALSATTLGIHIVVATFIGFITGWYLDKWFDTRPWLTLLMLILGVIAGFKNVFEEVRKIQRAEEREIRQAKGEAGAAGQPGKSGGAVLKSPSAQSGRSAAAENDTKST